MPPRSPRSRGRAAMDAPARRAATASERLPRPDSPLALRSPRHVAFFDRAFAHFFRRHMRALRLARWGRPQAPPAGAASLVVLANHPSWWDGVAVMLLARRLFPEHAVFVPMEARALE